MKSQKTIPSLQIGEIVKYYTEDETGEVSDEEYFYVMDREFKDGTPIFYLLAPIIPFQKNQNEKNSQTELELIRTMRGKVSDRFDGTYKSETTYYRAIFELEFRSVNSGKKCIPIDRVTSQDVHQDIETNAIKTLIRKNQISVMTPDGEKHYTIADGLAQHRAQPPRNGVPNYLDIDLDSAAKIGLIPEEVSQILQKHGKIKRLGTALSIVLDPDKDKIVQIYDRAKPHPQISPNEFAAAIESGMRKFISEMETNVEAFQNSLPPETLVRYAGKEKITFPFFPRRNDLSIDDAFETKFIAQKETVRVLKSAKIKTVAEAYNVLEEFGLSGLRDAFQKAQVRRINLSEVAEDIRLAYASMTEAFENPDEYEFPPEILIRYPTKEIG